MALYQAISLLIPMLAHGLYRQGLRSTKLNIELADYSFAKFAHDLGRRYVAGTVEYQLRVGLFEQSLERIRALNAKNTKEGGSWTAGLHEFMDWTPSERRSLQGYKPSRNKLGARVLAGLQVGANGITHSNTSLVDDAFGEQDSYIGQGARHRNQGNCGSCWAISAAEAVEAQLKRNGNDVSVSAKALVDCVPNPQHCGGSGGCDGATGDLAYAFMQKYGIPLEGDLPYTARADTCRMQPGASAYPTKRRVTLSGWDTMPSNTGSGLMKALVEQGSAVVAVDGNDWFDYNNGVYDGCHKDADLGHAVLAKGYGTDSHTGKNFWLIQNSWGTGWGENGDIRLLRHDSDDAWCGTDNKPSDGLGCDGGPPTIHVCGMCGVLYDTIVPKDVRIVDDNEVGSEAPASTGEYIPWKPDAFSTP